ncbi:hypothetical protein GQ457_12G018470 [Hibiscus cannabinus]
MSIYRLMLGILGYITEDSCRFSSDQAGNPLWPKVLPWVDRSASVNPSVFVDLHGSVDLTVSRGPYVLIDHTPALTPVMARRHYRASRSVTGMLKTHVTVHFEYPVSSMCYPIVVPGIPVLLDLYPMTYQYRLKPQNIPIRPAFSGVYPTRAIFRFLKCVSERTSIFCFDWMTKGMSRQETTGPALADYLGWNQISAERLAELLAYV